MKKILFLVLAFPSFVRAQNISLDSLHREFERYLTGPKQPEISIDGETFTPYEIKFEPTPESLFASFATDNQRLLEYLGSNYISLKDEYIYWHKSDSARFL